MAIPRHEMPTEDPDVRAANFDEVALGYAWERAQQEAERSPRGASKANSYQFNSIQYQFTLPRALDFAEEYGFARAEVSALAPLQFVARNLDSGGELRGRVKV